MLDKLRKQGQIPPPGSLATPLSPLTDPVVRASNGMLVPQLAFGLYKVPATDEGVTTILQAIQSGYRHFDTASYYGNEHTLGEAIAKSGISRWEFFVCSKVWNDAQKEGRQAVRVSVEKTLRLLNSDYIDLLLIHWPVPGCFVETYKELEVLLREGKIRGIGLSNFSVEEYEELVSSGISIAPIVNQFEVSPAMYRAGTVEYFQDRQIIVSASKSLHRGSSFEKTSVSEISQNHGVSPAQVMLRWGLQKGLVVVAKTSTKSRMTENRDIFNFCLSEDEMGRLDEMTTPEDVSAREDLERQRKTAL
mmetsp:Transcript_7634/g.17533  ORF Transcript_7634/g.17533 Transcript_7634/m.17533 type:complete len:305 (-) Transcript_7634:358-1272(-)